MSDANHRKGLLREFVEFALDQDVTLEIERQQSVLRAEPYSAKAHFDLGVLLYSQRRVGQAKAEYEAAIACDPSFACAYRKLGEIHVNSGEYELAGRYALKAAENGDRTLLDMFERYPAFKTYIERREDAT
jgi:tetratricopeptide (TPR) repeat protein